MRGIDMIRYEVRLKKMGQITALPDSQKLFGFLMSYSQRYFSSEIVSDFVKEILECRGKCMVSNLMPTGYYPTPKEYIMKKLEKRLKINSENMEKLEVEQERVFNEVKELKIKQNNLTEQIKKLKSKKEMENKKIKKQEREQISEEIQKKKVIFNENSAKIGQISLKNIYEAIKKIDFIKEDSLQSFFKRIETKENQEVTVKELEELEYLSKNQHFIQKFCLESQMKELPGLPNVAYSLPILSYYKKFSKKEEEQKQFSFFVKVEESSILSRTLEELKKSSEKQNISCFLGNKGSSGYNEYSIYEVQKLQNDEDKNSDLNIYLNLGMLLPNFDKIDSEISILDIHTSDRKPFDIENNIPKIISFITAGSIIKKQSEKIDIFEIGRSIPNKYNLLYKNAIVFGNSYLKRLEV